MLQGRPARDRAEVLGQFLEHLVCPGGGRRGRGGAEPCHEYQRVTKHGGLIPAASEPNLSPGRRAVPGSRLIRNPLNLLPPRRSLSKRAPAKTGPGSPARRPFPHSRPFPCVGVLWRFWSLSRVRRVRRNPRPGNLPHPAGMIGSTTCDAHCRSSYTAWTTLTRWVCRPTGSPVFGLTSSRGKLLSGDVQPNPVPRRDCGSAQEGGGAGWTRRCQSCTS